ncbi:RNA polymerase sigma factor [Cryptosporangium arvum]|uniref:RNA polymerase sigma factor, sigma-70 family n=1 Tax=Cryptosporangium arvum DSM 44712 TaxID=927661 RepID=A0A011AK25_9ACTN|nr:RNA polymerase sigma factor [Cryptosporangium arvum]EXG82321.1 RNA polymerase sigma factor, sigma-70 family [Cryptosporangium arvum DSM 44712]
MTISRDRLRAGEPDAFGDLFNEFAQRVYNYAYRLLSDWSAAEEVVSMTFLEAWRRRDRIEPTGASLLPWLLGIATNHARDFARARRRYRAALSRLPPPTAEPDFSEAVASRIDDDALLPAAQAALDGLRRAEREVVALCVDAELDYASAAEALGIPVGTVRSRLSRARAKLRAQLERSDATPPTGLRPAGHPPLAEPAAGPTPTGRKHRHG